jgi:hypothetical protein
VNNAMTSEKAFSDPIERFLTRGHDPWSVHTLRRTSRVGDSIPGIDDPKVQAPIIQPSQDHSPATIDRSEATTITDEQEHDHLAFNYMFLNDQNILADGGDGSKTTRRTATGANDSNKPKSNSLSLQKGSRRGVKRGRSREDDPSESIEKSSKTSEAASPPRVVCWAFRHSPCENIDCRLESRSYPHISKAL